MSKLLTQTVQSGDWKNEKHVPNLQYKKIEGGYKFKVDVGEEIGHPNTYDHHIAWIKVFFQPEGFKFPIEVGSYEFRAHGEDEVYTEPVLKAMIKTEKPGTLYAISYCNIHGLWENSIEVE